MPDLPFCLVYVALSSPDQGPAREAGTPSPVQLCIGEVTSHPSQVVFRAHHDDIGRFLPMICCHMFSAIAVRAILSWYRPKSHALLNSCNNKDFDSGNGSYVQWFSPQHQLLLAYSPGAGHESSQSVVDIRCICSCVIPEPACCQLD